MIDTFANLQSLVIPAGAGTGPQIDLFGAANIPAELQTAYGGTIVAAVIYRQSSTLYTYDAVRTGGQHVVGTVITAVGGTVQQLYSYGQSGVPSSHATMTFGSGPVAGYAEITISGGSNITLAPQGEIRFLPGNGTPALTFDGIDSPRGFTAQQVTPGATAALGAEAVVSTVTATFPALRTFRFEVNAAIFGTAPVGAYIVRRTNLAGAALWGGYALPNNAGFAFPGDEYGYLSNTTGAPITDSLVLTLQPLGGGTVQQFPVGAGRGFTLVDIGSAQNFTGNPI